MKIPMKWLREYVDVNMAPQEYASRMIMTGTAVEGVDKTGEQFDGVVVGRVLTCEDRPKSEELDVCKVEGGGEGRVQSVCGEQKVGGGEVGAGALEGARLPGGRIKRGKLRGVESQGMILAADAGEDDVRVIFLEGVPAGSSIH